MTPASRLLALLSLLQVRRDWPAAVLGARLGVSPRTVRRDVDHLRQLGYRVAGTPGPEGGYRLAAGADVPLLLFDDDQTVALVVGLRAAAATGADVAEAAERALATIRQVLPDRLRYRADTLPVTVVAPTATVDLAVLTTVGEAVRARRVLRFTYRSPGAPGGPAREVEPHHLVARSGRWYLIGWDLDRRDWRVFRADRIRPRVPGGPRFALRTLPGGDVGRYLEARFRGGDADWPCRGVVRVEASAAAIAPHVPDGAVEDLGHEGCRVSLGSWSWTALAAAVARFDAEVTGVAPSELAEAFGLLAGRLGRAAVTGP